MRFLKRIRGFSLLEILICLLLVGMLSTLSLSSFGTILERVRTRNKLEHLLDALNAARQEALLRRLPVNLCRSSDQKSCSPTGNAALLVFLEGEETMRKPEILHVFYLGKQRSVEHLEARLFPWQNSYLQFQPDGKTAEQNGSFWYCCAGKPSWAVLLSKSGRFRVLHPNAQGQIKNEKGENFLC